jgi:hypothetical protein
VCIGVKTRRAADLPRDVTLAVAPDATIPARIAARTRSGSACVHDHGGLRADVASAFVTLVGCLTCFRSSPPRPWVASTGTPPCVASASGAVGVAATRWRPGVRTTGGVPRRAVVVARALRALGCGPAAARSARRRVRRTVWCWPCDASVGMLGGDQLRSNLALLLPLRPGVGEQEDILCGRSAAELESLGTFKRCVSGDSLCCGFK